MWKNHKHNTFKNQTTINTLIIFIYFILYVCMCIMRVWESCVCIHVHTCEYRRSHAMEHMCRSGGNFRATCLQDELWPGLCLINEYGQESLRILPYAVEFWVCRPILSLPAFKMFFWSLNLGALHMTAKALHWAMSLSHPGFFAVVVFILQPPAGSQSWRFGRQENKFFVYTLLFRKCWCRAL